MAKKVIYKNEEIEFYQEDKPSIFSCAECGQIGNEAPVRSKDKKKKLLTYHSGCAQGVIFRQQRGEAKHAKLMEAQKLSIPNPLLSSSESISRDKTPLPVVTKSYLRPVVDEELERKKAKLKAMIKGDLEEVLAKENDVAIEKPEPKPKARIQLNESGEIILHHKYDKNLIDKYHFIKQIKWLGGEHKYWYCKINEADFETCRFFFKIHKEIPRFDWLISEEAYTAIKQRLDILEEQIRATKEIKELKVKEDVDIDLSHMKVPPFPYQKVGVAFMNKVDGVGIIGDSMGLGKCVLENTTLFTDVGMKKIKDFFDFNQTFDQKDKDGGEWYKLTELVRVPSINTYGQLIYNRVTHIYRQEINEQIKVVKLTDGTEIECTLAHKLLTLNGWQNKIEPGQYVLAPRKLRPINPGKIDKNLNFFLAWLISEGCELSTRKTLTITQRDITTLEMIKQAIESYSLANNININQPGIYISKNDRVPFLRINSVQLVSHLESLGYVFGHKSAKKSIPQVVMNAEDCQVKEFLMNYFEAEGSVRKSQQIVEITSASKELIEQLAILLKRWGIWLRISTKMKMATNGLKIKRPYYTGIIGGSSLRLFRDEIGFASQNKTKSLVDICAKEPNDNVDVVPTVDLCKRLYQVLPLPASITGIEHAYVRLHKPQNLSRKTAQRVLEKLDLILTGEAEAQYLLKKRSKWTDKVLACFKSMNVNFVKEIRAELAHRLTTNAFYVQVKSVEYKPHKGYVYDISVEKDHNYVANGIYSHNTLQGIAYTSLNNFRTVVVCPASLKYNWKKEIEKFTNKTAVVLTEYDAESLNPKNLLADYVIVNYEQLEKYDKYLKKSKFDCVILDESQYIMNLQAKRTKHVFKYFKKITHRICMSGTPIKNRPIEFYAQLKFIRPDLFSNKMKFALRYCDAKETPFGWDLKGASNLDELNRKISSFYIRRIKQEVLKELPPKTVTVIDVELGSTEKAEYNRIKNDLNRVMSDNWKQYGNAYEERRVDGNHLAKLMELKQFCSRQKVSRVVEFVKEFLDSSDNRKIIVFSQFIATQKALRDAFPGISVSLLGEDSAEKRNDAVERFQNDPKIRVFVGSTVAAGVGLTLTAADTVVFTDLMWSPADHEQAADRVHRISQENPVFIYYMLFKDTIESMIWGVIGHKLTVLAKTLDGKELKEVQPDVVKQVFSQILREFKIQRNLITDELDLPQ